jgi:hypothetical protein
MTTLRCTAKLLKALKVTPVALPAPAANRLGGWTANLIRASRRQFVLAVNDATRFGVLIDAAPYAEIPSRLVQRVFKALQYIGVSDDLAAAEAQALEAPEFAATNSKSVLGTLNQFAFAIECDVHYGDAHSAEALAQRLAEAIVVSPKDIGYPADRVREQLGLPPLDRRWPAANDPKQNGPQCGP